MAKVTPVQQITHYSLELNKLEFSVLIVILGRIIGDPNRSYRKQASDIYEVLTNTIDAYDPRDLEKIRQCIGSSNLRFENHKYE